MNFMGWIQSHQRSLLFLLAALAIAGAVSSFNMPVSLFPQVSFPRVAVTLDAGDRPAERMAVEVTWPVEEAVRAVPGVRTVRSTTSRGSADISLNFAWGQDMVAAALQVESAINQIMADLPAGTAFEVRRMDPTVFPVIAYSMTSDSRTPVELRDLAQYQIRPVLSTVQGVAKVAVQGGDVAEYEVIVSPDRLEALGMTITDVADAVSAANVVSAVGRLEDHYKLYLVLAQTQFATFDEIARTVLRSGKGGIVRLSDVATVSPGAQPNWTRVTANGRDAVLFLVYQQPGANTLAIQRAVKQKLGHLGNLIPDDVAIANWYDQTQLIVASATSVRDATVIGIVLAAVVLLLFLRHLKVTLIAAFTVPAVLATTVLLLFLRGMSFNIMTLGGMAAAVALIIDDSIVMIEHIVRRLRGARGHYQEHVVAAAREFTIPLAGSSASTMIIFAPLAFLTGVTGAFFKALSLTMAAALLVSFVIAWLAIPILARHLLTQRDCDAEQSGPFFQWLQRRYEGCLGALLKAPWLALLAVVPLLVLGWMSYRSIGSGFIPPMDEGGFILDYRSAPGRSLDETDRLLRQIEAILRDTPEVASYSRRTGLQLGGAITEANEGDYFIQLIPQPRRGIEEVMDEVRQRVEHDVPGLDIEMALLMEDLIGDLTAVPQPIEIKIFSDDGNLLQQLAPRVAESIGSVPGVVDVNNGLVIAGDAIEIHVDRERASLEGVAPDGVREVLAQFLEGDVPTQIQEGPKLVGIRVWIPQRSRATAADIEQLRMRAPDGHYVRIGRIATIDVLTGQPQIMREDLKRMVAVTARISGRDLGSTVRDVVARLKQDEVIPADVRYELGGLYQQQQIAFRGLITVFAAAVALVFFLLLLLYERFFVTIAMLVTTLLALMAVFIGLWLTGTELNITSMMGMTMIVGIVTEVSIFYFSEFQALAQERHYPRRLVLAGSNRLRPITMTTVAAIFALMPLALGIGEGSAMLRPLAIAIISGLCVQLPLVLLVLPAVLRMLRAGQP